MSRVIVVQQPLKREGGRVVPRINYAHFDPYGTYEFLFEWGELRDDDVLEDTASYITRLRAKLHNYTDDDYLVLLGNPALCAMAVAVAADYNDGRVTLLDWIRDQHRYRVVRMDLDADLASAKVL